MGKNQTHRDFPREEIEKIIKTVQRGCLILKQEGMFKQCERSIARTVVLRSRCMKRIITEEIDRFEYDDEKARPIIKMAKQGDPDALAALAELLEQIGQRQQPLPPNLGAHVVAVYRGEAPPKRKRPRRYRNRDAWLGAIMEELVNLGFEPYANGKRKHKSRPSAGMIILEAYTRVRDDSMAPLTVRSIEKLWQKRCRSLRGGSGQKHTRTEPPEGVGILLGRGRPNRT